MKTVTVFTGRGLDVSSVMPFVVSMAQYCVWPEAYVHPSDQRSAIESIVRNFLADTATTRLIVLTNSPYILTSLNVLVGAGYAYEKYPRSSQQIGEIVRGDTAISPGILKAFSLEKGALTDVIDPEFGLISASVIASASDQIGKAFDAISDILSDDVRAIDDEATPEVTETATVTKRLTFAPPVGLNIKTFDKPAGQPVTHVSLVFGTTEIKLDFISGAKDFADYIHEVQSGECVISVEYSLTPSGRCTEFHVEYVNLRHSFEEYKPPNWGKAQPIS